MTLTVYISSATDGYFLVKAKELPDLAAKANSIEGIPDAARAAAANLTGRAPSDFDVIADY